MPSVGVGYDVLRRALERIERVYDEGHRVVVSFSGGKDSAVVLELALMVAREKGKLPLQVAYYDEEIIYPGTAEYVERTAARPDIELAWTSNHKPQVNAFSRAEPYWWTFDEALNPSEWVRQPPSQIEWIKGQDLGTVTSPSRYPPDEGKKLVVLLGMRASESMNRRMAIFASKGFMPKHPCDYGSYLAKPIFDWKDSDVWKFISENKIDYNQAYNLMFRLGVARNRLRIAPPTMTASGVGKLSMAAKAWPRWFDRLCARLPGVRTAAQFGKKAVRPQRHYKETWKECFYRTCITEAPEWIAKRAAAYIEAKQRVHARHSSSDIPDRVRCPQCVRCGSYQLIAYALFMGDPYSLKDTILPYADPAEFRDGAASWYSKSEERKKERERDKESKSP